MKKESVPLSQDEVKKARREMARSALFALAALIVLIFACIAWFVRNTEVNGISGSVEATGSTFELASAGKDEGAFKDKIPEKYNTTGSVWTYLTNKGTQTESNNTILWQLTDKSNIGNDDPKENETSDEKGIVPGSSGKLEFYVIPKIKSECRVKFHLNILPLKENDKGEIEQYSEEDPDFTTLTKLLKGHIMFSYRTAEEKNSTRISSDTQEFSITFSGNEPALVTLEWQWPYQWTSIDETVRKEIEKETGYRNYFFYPASEEDDSADDGYNRADMLIGENVTWLMVQLSAQPG